MSSSQVGANDADIEAELHADDPTQSSPGKERKRVQNRLAQRTYRRRMKTRLDELQAKLKIHEQRAESSTMSQSCTSTSAASTAPTAEDSTSLAPARRYSPDLDVDFFLELNDVNESYAPLQYRMPVVNQPTTLLDSNDLTVTPSQADPTCTWVPSHKLQDSDVYQTGTTSTAASLPEVGIPPAISLETLSSSPHDHQHANVDGPLQQSPSLPTVHLTQERTQTVVSADSPVKDRIRHVMDQAGLVGFKTFDEAVAAYYTEVFEAHSSLSQDQRFSRNRRLPLLLNTLHNAAKSWTVWERRGFQEQITSSAEEILMMEMSSFIAQRPVDDISIENSGNDPLVGKRLGNIMDSKKRLKIQDNLPNLWALTTALLADRNVLGPDERTNATLAIVEILCFGQQEKRKARVSQTDGRCLLL